MSAFAVVVVAVESRVLDAVFPLVGVVLGAGLTIGYEMRTRREQDAGEQRGAVRVVYAEIGYAFTIVRKMNEDQLAALKMDHIDVGAVSESVRQLGRIADYETWLQARAVDRWLRELQTLIATPGPERDILVDKLRTAQESLKSIAKPRS